MPSTQVQEVLTTQTPIVQSCMDT